MIKFALKTRRVAASVLGLAITTSISFAGVASADEYLGSQNTYNFQPAATTYQGLVHQYGYQSPLPTQQIVQGQFPGQVPVQAPVQAPVQNPVQAFVDPAAVQNPSQNNQFNLVSRFQPYRYVRADLSLISPKYSGTDAAAQAITFKKAKTSVGLRAGIMLRKHFGIEGRLGLGLGSETKSQGTATSKYKTNGYLGVLGRGQYDLGNGFMPYANLGLMAVKSSFSSQSGGTNITVDQTDVGLAAAIGVEVNLRRNWVLGVEASYMPTNIKALSATVGYNF